MSRRVPPALVAAGLLALPVAIGALYSLLAASGLAGAGAAGFSSRAFSAVLGSPDPWRSAAWTIAVAAAATVLATAAACSVAFRVRDSRAGQLLAILPMAVPHVAAALAALLLLAQSGLLSRLAFAAGITTTPADFPALVYDTAGVSLVVAFAWKEFPYLAFTALAVLLTQADQLEETARTLGATPRQTFWRVTGPRLWRGLAPASIAAFAFLVGQYEMPALLAPSDPLALPLLTYERSVAPDLSRRGEAHVLALVALTVTLLLVVAHAVRRARLDGEE